MRTSIPQPSARLPSIKLRMSHSVLDFDDLNNDWKTIEVPLQENPIKSSKLKITGVVKVSLSWTPHTMMVQMDGQDSASAAGGRRSSFTSSGSGRNAGMIGDDDGENSKSLDMDDEELEDLCDEDLSDDEQVRRKLQRSNTQQNR